MTNRHEIERAYSRTLPSPIFMSTPLSAAVVSRKPVALGSEGSIRIVTPLATVQPYPLQLPASQSSPTTSRKSCSSNCDVEEVAHQHRASPPRLPSLLLFPTTITFPTLPQLPERTKQRQRSEPDTRTDTRAQWEERTHARNLSFDPNLVSSKAKRHPHEHGKTTGYRRRGTSLKLLPLPRTCVAGELGESQSTCSGDALLQHGLITPPPSAHGLHTLGSEAPFMQSHQHKNRCSGPPVPPKDFPTAKKLETRNHNASDKSTAKTSTDLLYGKHTDYGSFFDDDEDDDKTGQVLRKMMAGLRMSQGSSGSGDAEKSFERYGRPRSESVKSRSRRKSGYVQRLREVVLCARNGGGDEG